METENLSTAASRFALRSATELVGDKEPRPAPSPKPSPVATLAPVSKPAAVATYSTLNNSKMAQDRAILTMADQ